MAPRKTKDLQGYALIVGVVVILIAIFVVKLSQDAKPRAGADNCIGTPVANTVLIIDHSEQVSDQTRDEIMARAMARIHGHVKVNERVSVFTISDLSKKSLKPLVSRCRPPDPGNRFVTNPALMRKALREKFEMPLQQSLAIAVPDAKESPITQAITDVSLSQYLRGDGNTLMIFSDMLENTQSFSLYRCPSASGVVAAYRESRRGAQERPQFKNTAVLLNMIPRLEQARETVKCRDQLWTWFFGDNSGAQAGLSLEYLPGGATGGFTTKVRSQ
jgi:hypothetical protein